MCVTTPVTFLEVVDGDTIWVKKEGEKVLVEFEGIDAPELAHEENQTQDCLHDQKKAEKARDLIQDMLSSAKEVGLIIKEEINEQKLRAQVYADGLSVGQELLYKYLAVEGQGNWCGISERD
jgi:endonuclease YncB( thermonuclease family)